MGFRANAPAAYFFIIVFCVTQILPRETHRLHRAGLHGGHVGDLGCADHGPGDQTLNAELHDLNRDEVLVGDVDEILGGGGETHTRSGEHTNAPSRR